jgi:hypothetical protein
MINLLIAQLSSILIDLTAFFIQVKTVSFLTFLLRSYSEYLKPFESSIVKSVLMLLQRCPEESVNTRKVFTFTLFLLLSFFLPFFFFLLLILTNLHALTLYIIKLFL